MNINKKRHELLCLLFNKRADLELKRSEYNILGVSFEDIEKSLNLTSDELLLISTELIELKEICFHDTAGITGLACLEKGATSFANKKYIKLINAEQKDFFEFKISKWKYHTFWWFFGLAIFGGAYSVYDIIKNLTKQEYDQSKLMTKAEMELEVSKLHTLILSQKMDSVLVPTNYPLKK